MLATLIQKELRAIILSPKFFGSFAICSILILLSVFTGIQEYKASQKQYDAATNLVNEELLVATSWGNLDTKAYRAPDPMQVFVSGLSYDVGRWSNISPETGVKLRHSAYSDDPIFAVFRFVDFAFIVMFVLSLIAIQFTYDAVNGERESGTLRLVFSNAVPRAKYLLAKCVGSWLGLAVPLGVPILLGLLLVLVMGVPLSVGHWAKIATLLALSLLLFTFFVFLGVLISTLTRRSSVSFLVAILVWVLFVMIIPRAGVMAAGGMVNVPRVAEVEAQREGFANERWDKFYADMIKVWENSCSISAEGRWQSMKAEDSARKAIEQEIEEFDARLQEDLQQRRTRQEDLAWTLARFSPAAAYQLAAMSLAETDTQNKTQYEDAMSTYREQFSQVVEQKRAESGDELGISIGMSMTPDGKQEIAVGSSRDLGALDVSDLPRFEPPKQTYAETAAPTVVDFGLIMLSILITFAGAFVAFLRYDVR
ncbi:MAG: hypothetical protein DRP45_03115 [Candidatus Zixiibacteriota bacterium]|nr:MAG: hypothetical protein DRP45_03115 [candidate division Zixibacteria bacterium]